MKILALEKEFPGAIAEQFQALLKDEACRVWELQQSGLIREIYLASEHRNAVLMLESSGVEEAQQALATLPLVNAGLIEFVLIPLIPYPGFARLFEHSMIRGEAPNEPNN